MRANKADLLAELNRDYDALKVTWGGFRGYDRWFAAGTNNALLASIAIYTQHVPAFTALFAERGGDFPAFYEAVRRLAQLPPAARKAALERLASLPAPESSPATSAH